MNNSGFDLSLDSDAHCFFISYHGVLTPDILAEKNGALKTHKDFKWDMNRLMDLTNCKVDLNAEDVRAASDVISARNATDGQYRGAYVVDSALSHGIIRIFEALVKSPVNEYKIFKSDIPDLEGQVKAWLELTEGYCLPDFMRF